MSELHTDIRYVKGVGEARAKSLAKLGITDLRSLLSYFPRAYEDRRAYKHIDELTEENRLLTEKYEAIPKIFRKNP